MSSYRQGGLRSKFANFETTYIVYGHPLMYITKGYFLGSSFLGLKKLGWLKPSESSFSCLPDTPAQEKCFKISEQKLDIPMIVEGEEERSIFGHVQEGTTPSLNIVIWIITDF